MTLSLHMDKLNTVPGFIKMFSTENIAMKLELQRIAGNLSTCSTKAGKTFSWRVINIIKYFPSNRESIKLSNEFYADLKWWSVLQRCSMVQVR